MKDTLTNTYASVDSNGTVFWSRPGRLKSNCKYVGLQHFPFDELSCKIEFGSWAHSGNYVRPIKLSGTGWTSNSSLTSGSSFEEFKLLENKINVQNHAYPPYPGSPEDNWPVLIYSLFFRRSSKPYLRGVILINVLLNIAAFCCFWIPPNVGERMSLAITCVLSAVAGELVVASHLPNCEEITWYNKFALGSSAFALAVVFESAAVIFFFYYTGIDLTPLYVKWIRSKIHDKEAQSDERIHKVNRGGNSATKIGSAYNDHQSKQSRSSIMRNMNGDTIQVPCLRLELDLNSTSKRSITTGVDSTKGNKSVEWKYESSSLFQDDKSNESISDTNFKTEASNSYGALRNSSYRTTADTFRSDRRNKRRSLANSLYMDEHQLAVKLVDAGNFKSEKDAEMNAKWQIVAGCIDEFARLLMPAAYLIFLMYFFSSEQTKISI